MIASAALALGPATAVVFAFLISERINRKARRARARAAWQTAWSLPRD